MALVVITGGARSGKSSAAQVVAERRMLDGAHVVVAVFGRAGDAEMGQRIERHRAERPPAFETIEAKDARAWMAQVPEDALLLVDCLGTLLGQAMEKAWERVAEGGLEDAEENSLPEGYAAALAAEFHPTLSWIASRGGDTLVVTNEVGGGVVPEWASARLFRDELGRANRVLVEAADAAYLAVAGRLLSLHNVPRSIQWPED